MENNIDMENIIRELENDLCTCMPLRICVNISCNKCGEFRRFAAEQLYKMGYVKVSKNKEVNNET